MYIHIHTHYITLHMYVYIHNTSDIHLIIKTHGSELRDQEKRPRDDYRESIYAYQNVLKNGKQN